MQIGGGHRSAAGRGRRAASLAAALALAVVLGACGTAAGPSASSGVRPKPATATGSPATPTASPRKATLMLDWYPNGDHAGIYSAKAKGYDRAHGIDLQIQVPADPSTALKAVALGKVDFAVNYEPGVMLARALGIPVVAIMAMVQRPLNTLMALRSSGITRPGQLKGKRIGVDGTPSTQALVDTMLRDDGVQPSQVTFVNVSEDNVAALLAHKVDAIAGAYWNWEAVEIALKGQPVNIMPVEKWGVPNYDELVFVTSNALAAKHPGLVRDFVAAMVAGERYAQQHPTGAANALLAANKDLSRPLVMRSVKLLQPAWQGKAPAIGYMDPAQWSSYEKWMRGHGLLSKSVPVGQAMTNRFLPSSAASGG